MPDAHSPHKVPSEGDELATRARRPHGSRAYGVEAADRAGLEFLGAEGASWGPRASGCSLVDLAWSDARLENIVGVMV